MFHKSLLLALVFILCSLTHAKDVLIPTDSIKTHDNSKYYLLSIGIDNYQDKFWPQLKWPTSDAKKVSNEFGENTQYEVFNKVLLNRRANLQTVKDTLINIAKQAKHNDSVILYFSGHGTLQQNDSGEFSRIVVLNDTKKDALFETGLTHTWLKQWLDTLKSKKKMIIFATCNSGVGKSRVPSNIELLLSSRKGKLIPLEDASEGALILAAAAKGEAAREDDKLQGDIYTHFLLEALTIYDRNHDGMVSALEAHDYAREKTWSYTKGKQRPTADIELIGNADIPLSGQKSRSPLPILEAYDEELAGFRVQVDNQEKGRLPLAFALNPNGSEIVLYPPLSDESLARYSVNVNQGETINLDKIMNYRPLGISSDLIVNSWKDRRWEQLSGSDNSTDINIKAFWEIKHINFGFSYTRSLSSNQTTIRQNLKSTLDYYRYAAEVAYVYLWKKFKIQVTGSLGKEIIKLELKDVINGDSLNYNDSSLSQGVSMQFSTLISPQLRLGVTIGRQYGNWTFDDLGDLNGERNWLSFNAHYQFHWKYRRL